jgi:hypothetical protein
LTSTSVQCTCHHHLAQLRFCREGCASVLIVLLMLLAAGGERSELNLTLPLSPWQRQFSPTGISNTMQHGDLNSTSVRRLISAIREALVCRVASSYRFLAGLAVSLLVSCAVDPNEGVFVVNGITTPRLTEARLIEIRRAWTPTSEPMSESTKAGRLYSYWILDLIAHQELTPTDDRCSKLDLHAIRAREVDLLIPRLGPAGDVHFFRAATYHEAWIVNVCGEIHEWRVLDDVANPQNPLRVFFWGVSKGRLST